MTTDANGDELLGYAGILMPGGEPDELRPSRTGSLFLAYDLARYKGGSASHRWCSNRCTGRAG